MIGPISHDPQELWESLLSHPSRVFCDVETTGLNRHDRVLSIGLRFDGMTYILFTKWCCHSTIVPHVSSDTTIRVALGPLNGLPLVFHNAKFDLPRLQEYDVGYGGEIIDTLQLHRLFDQDRGFISESQGRHRPRVDLTAPDGPRYENYRLKDVCSQLCNIKAFYTPDRTMQLVPLETHRLYLAHDLLCTERLYEHLWQRLSPSLRQWWLMIGSPLTHELCKLTDIGIAADAEFIGSEVERIGEAMAAISDAHATQHSVALADMGDWVLRKLIYKQYGLPSQREKGELSLDDETLENLIQVATSNKIRDSLGLIRGYRELKSLRTRLAGYATTINLHTGRIHSSFDNRQSTGRISSSKPNLQQLAKVKVVLAGTPFGTTVTTRDLLVATPGYVMTAADTQQSDPRVLAHAIAACPYSTKALVDTLQHQRAARLDLGHYQPVLEACRNPNFVGTYEPPPSFDPNAVHQLVEDFHNPTGDLYVQMATNVLGQTITKNDPMRKIVKTVFLAQLNGQTPKGLGKVLKCNVAEAKQRVDQFFAVYNDIDTFLWLLRWKVAITGQTETWAGRTRTIMAHRWMVEEPRVRVLLTYKNGESLWYDVSPIHPSLRTLTCFVHRIWSVQDRNAPKLIYTPSRGRIGTRHYAHVDDTGLLYYLPIRNLPWRSIRRVQKLDAAAMPVEEAVYEGFDATARYAISAVMQGGTADLTTDMMLRSRPVLQQFNARLLLQVHDELVAECPQENQQAFTEAWRAVLETPPEGFQVPVRVDMASGHRYGDCK